MRSWLGAAFFAIVTLSATVAQAVVVDFSHMNGRTLAEGDIIGTADGLAFDFGNGLTGTITVMNRKKNIDRAVIFDTNPNTASQQAMDNDPDLVGPLTNANDPNDVRPDLGNVLIIDEINSNGYPDDQAGPGGSITFAFDRAIDLTSITILDGEENISLITENITVGNLGAEDNEFEVLNFDSIAGIREFTVDFAGSGALASFSARVSVVPLPAPALLLLSAIAGLGWLGWRRRQAA